MRGLSLTDYRFLGEGERLRLAVVADFHNGDVDSVMEGLREIAPDVILLPGDVVHSRHETERGLALLRAAARLAPAFMSPGNHEARCGKDFSATLAATGARVLDNGFVTHRGLVIGGLSSGFYGKKQGRLKRTPDPDTEWLADFESTPGTKLLLCHHPEYYPRLLAQRGPMLIVAGHAHGGQWQIFGRGLFAPGQGLLPRYTHGVYVGRRHISAAEPQPLSAPTLMVSRGAQNSVGLPRIMNPTELLVIEMGR